MVRDGGPRRMWYCGLARDSGRTGKNDKRDGGNVKRESFSLSNDLSDGRREYDVYNVLFLGDVNMHLYIHVCVCIYKYCSR